MVGELYYVQTTNQLPNIGSGFRLVEAFVGRKWARVRCPWPGQGYATRLRVADWDRIPKSVCDDRPLSDIIEDIAGQMPRRKGKTNAAAA